ncbi:hypothetical protein C0J52_21431 [Blattella germanica]|nr:hypothetical protein C0J52_21431 [Blattella germanica]
MLLLGDSKEILQDNMHILRSNTRELGLEVNINKTKYMVTRRNASCRPRMKWENNINHDLREDRDVWRAYVCTAMNLRV